MWPLSPSLKVSPLDPLLHPGVGGLRLLPDFDIYVHVWFVSLIFVQDWAVNCSRTLQQLYLTSILRYMFDFYSLSTLTAKIHLMSSNKLKSVANCKYTFFLAVPLTKLWLCKMTNDLFCQQSVILLTIQHIPFIPTSNKIKEMKPIFD